MRLMECLNQSDMGQLAQIARSHRLEVPTYSKSAILQELLTRFADKKYLRQRLIERHSSFLTIIKELAITGRDRYAKDELYAVVRRMLHVLEMGDVKAQEVIEAMLLEGVLFEIGSRSGRMYIFPEDIWKKIHALTHTEASAGAVKAEAAPIIVRDDETAMARDATTLLFFCGKSPLPLTVDGSLYKRTQQQVMQLFELPEEILPERTGWRFGFHPHYRHYPARFALLYDFWLTNGAWVEQDGQLHVEEGAGQAILMISEEKRAELLFRYYLDAYRNVIPSLQQVIKKISEITRAAWVYEAAIKAEISPWISDYYYASREVIVHEHLLAMLLWLGFIKSGELKSGETVYQLSALGVKWLGPHLFSEDQTPGQMRDVSPQEKASVTPDFEILVPSSVESRYGFDLRKIAVQVKSDRIRVFRITKESVRRAAHAGWTREQLFLFLEHLSQHPIPQNVEATVADWYKSAGNRVSLHE